MPRRRPDQARGRGGTRHPGGRAWGLLLGALADQVAGDPRRGHPVAAFGTATGRLERAVYRDDRAAGVVFVAGAVGGTVALGAALERAAGNRRAASAALVAAATWTVLGGTSLRREASAVQRALAAGDLPGARSRMRSLVGRDMSAASEADVARATVESVAENLSDAVVAPLFWGAVGGVPGLLGYRAANTLDAMVGYRSPRYARFGWAAARLDDALNVVPARLTAGLVALVSGRPRAVLTVVRGDAWRHPSPNAGWCESAFAGALDVRLGGTNVYDGRVEHRAVMGTGPAPQPADIARANALGTRVGLAAVLVCAALVRWRR